MSAIYPVGATIVRGETLALSTTLASLGVPYGMKQAILYVPATNFRFHLNPAIKGVWFYDDSLLDGSEYVNLHRAVTDRDTGTGTGSSLNSMTTSDKLYILLNEPIGGLRVTIGNTNSTASVMTVKYSKSDNTFANITVTDGTDSPAGTTLGATGSLTWTLPTDWEAQTLADLAVAIKADRPPSDGYWLEITVSIALDATVSITELWTLNKNATRLYGHATTEYGVSFDARAIGAIEAVLAAGTDTLDLNWIGTVQ